MMTVDPPETIMGIPEEVAKSDVSLWEKAIKGIKIASDTISYVDAMDELHIVDFASINRRIWRERLLEDVEEFAAEIRKQKKKQVEENTDMI